MHPKSGGMYEMVPMVVFLLGSPSQGLVAFAGTSSGE